MLKASDSSETVENCRGSSPTWPWARSWSSSSDSWARLASIVLSLLAWGVFAIMMTVLSGEWIVLDRGPRESWNWSSIAESRRKATC